MVRVRLLVGMLALLVLAGCTRSLEFTYKPGPSRVAVPGKAGTLFGVAKLVDKRSWVDVTDEKGQSYIAQQGPWKFGLTHEGREYIPLNDLVQSLFITELRTAGFQAKPLNGVASKQTAQELRQLGQQAGTDYAIGGEILVFEFVNEDKGFTVTTRRSVTLTLIIVQTRDGQPVVDSTFSELQREGQGMGALHTTNADKLLNGAFKTLAYRVITEVARKLELSSSDISIRFVSHAQP